MGTKTARVMLLKDNLDQSKKKKKILPGIPKNTANNTSSEKHPAISHNKNHKATHSHQARKVPPKHHRLPDLVP